jgi:Ala-tRNA(Pro) deacylase
MKSYNMAETLEKNESSALPTKAKDLLRYLDEHEVEYSLHEHEPIFTVAEGEHLKKNIPGLHCRNLFVRDKKQSMFLVVLQNETIIDLKKLQTLLGCGRLSFGSKDRLWRHLGVRPGSVCPYSVINDKDNVVEVVLEKAMMEADIVNYHPLENHLTIGVKPKDLIRFLKSCNHDPMILDFKCISPDEKELVNAD